MCKMVEARHYTIEKNFHKRLFDTLSVHTIFAVEICITIEHDGLLQTEI